MEFPNTDWFPDLLAVAEGRVADARAHYERAVATGPSNPEARNNLGAVLIAFGETTAAIPYLQEAIRLRSQYPEARARWQPASGSRRRSRKRPSPKRRRSRPGRARSWSRYGRTCRDIVSDRWGDLFAATATV